MTSFDELSYEEQKRRWIHIARTLMDVYDMRDARMELFSFSNNAVLEVKRGDDTYILRLHRPGITRAEWVQSEMQWLTAIREQTDIIVPCPIDIGGEYVVSIDSDDMNAPVYCVMFKHIEGEGREPANITSEEVYRVGILLAKLHNFSEQFIPPDGFSRPWLDWEGLFGENSPYNPGDGAKIFTDDQRKVFASIGAAVRAAMDELGQTNDVFGLIHGDLLAQNVLFYQGEARALDFEYGGLGYYLYDLTPMLWQLRKDPRYLHLRDVLWAGYTGVRPLPERQRELLDTFIVGRHLASCRWIAGNLSNASIRDYAIDIIAERTEEMRRFLRTGIFPNE